MEKQNKLNIFIGSFSDIRTKQDIALKKEEFYQGKLLNLCYLKDNCSIKLNEDKKYQQNFAVINNLMQVKNNKIFISNDHNDHKLGLSPSISKNNKTNSEIIKSKSKKKKTTISEIDKNLIHLNNNDLKIENRPYSSIIKKNLNEYFPMKSLKENRNFRNYNEENSTKDTCVKTANSIRNSVENLNVLTSTSNYSKGHKKNVSKYYFLYKLKK